MKPVTLPLTPETIESLHAGEAVALSGELHVARDAAHARLVSLLESGQPLPFPLRGAVIYYMGPTPTPDGGIIGSCGPTTASRMDPFAPVLLAHGLAGMIGKGQRSAAVVEALIRHRAIYFYAYGGCGAFYASRVAENRLIAFEDLGPEAVYRLIVKDFPVIVANDCHGASAFFEPA
ncbi:MAG: fumarate hydratase [Deltaproteobacteria bacterium HGW-Deltaproteobacteria-17]|nr:MAG: fumarate hydratase [Deltaproteobacteria bacterium HGW-Deltaproteobacteria-17]